MTDNIFAKLATPDSLKVTSKSLKENGMHVIIAKNSHDAKKEALKLIPKGAEVMTATSQTLEALGLNHEINETGQFNAVKSKLMQMNRETQSLEMQKLGAAPEYVIGSVHAVTEDGHILIASATGSQLPSYVYGASHVIWVVGTQKIVKDVKTGMERIRTYTVPLENERAMKAYGRGTSLNKLLLVNKERPGRITIIFVKENLGF